MPLTIFRFCLIDFQLNTDFPSQFCVFFFLQPTSVTQRSVSQENAYKKKKNQKAVAFFAELLGSYDFFLTLIGTISGF